MCSQELIDYCEEHSIKQPFTEKSMEIKKELRRIVEEYTTPEMSEEEKIKELSKYIINLVSYNFEYANSEQYILSDEEKYKDMIRRGWWESLWYTLMEGDGLCAGYSEVALDLFTESGIYAYKLETVGHAFNMVKIGEDYYQIDLTNLDYYLDVIEKSVEEYDFEFEYFPHIILLISYLNNLFSENVIKR